MKEYLLTIEQYGTPAQPTEGHETRYQSAIQNCLAGRGDALDGQLFKAWLYYSSDYFREGEALDPNAAIAVHAKRNLVTQILLLCHAEQSQPIQQGEPLDD